ncbi:MAG: hypothetical protein K2X71_01610 [Methylobacterium sp.]|uniref:hypothetical protein n=1 Tax=Methylobacterium sp. TaxID=409 RepID=UPI00258EAC61|nr:hypothetical protein [Methylobacterium sp.]MBY0294724.1 hypothetical protein [Methylobacterium sp.]
MAQLIAVAGPASAQDPPDIPRRGSILSVRGSERHVQTPDGAQIEVGVTTKGGRSDARACLQRIHMGGMRAEVGRMRRLEVTDAP